LKGEEHQKTTEDTNPLSFYYCK